MRKYCLGVSAFLDGFLKSELGKTLDIDGFFDNDIKKWGEKKYSYRIEKPYYDEDIHVIITVGKKFWIELIKQMLELGYRKFSLVKRLSEDNYKLWDFDYSNKNYANDKGDLILLYLEYNSYAGIRSIQWLEKHALINTHNFRLKIFVNDIESQDYYYDLIVAKYIITERCSPYIEYNVEIQKIQMWHGFPLKAMERMASNYDENGDESLRKLWDSYKYILSYGLNYTTMISACFGTRLNQFAVTGMPRNDLLFYTDGKINLEKLFPECEGKKIVLYMPTFREIAGNRNGNDEGYIFYWNDFKLEKFENSCRENNIYFIFKLHPSDESKVRNWCEQSDCIGILNDESLGEQCTYELLNGVDILITDYSSVYYDYMLLDRPIIFTNRDEEEYIANRGFIFEPADFWRPGPIVNTMKDLQREIENVLHGEDSHKDYRRQLMPFVHKYTDGNSTQRLFDLLKEDSEKTNE